MRKILSILCAVALLATCIISVPASASTETLTFPVTVSIPATGTTQTATVVNPSDTTKTGVIEFTLPDGDGWGYKLTGTGYNGNNQTEGENRPRAGITTDANGATYIGIGGSELAITKKVDITPGYTYTITADTYAYSSGFPEYAYPSISYELYHKDANGTYTKINDYLATKTDYTVTTTFNKAQGDNHENAGVTDNTSGGTFATKVTVTLSFTVTCPDVNVVEVGLGGYPANVGNAGTGGEQRPYYKGFTVAQDATAELDSYTSYYHIARLTPNGFATVNGTLYDANGNGYVHSFDIPTGWDWVATPEATLGQSFVSTNSPANRKRINVETKSSDGITYIGKNGPDTAVTKYVDIEPGYSYTLTSTGYTKSTNTNARGSLEYWLYHKNDDGSYTPINEYLTSINADTIPSSAVLPPATHNLGLQTETTTWDGSNAAKAHTFSLTFNVTDPHVNAIKVGIGGYGSPGFHTDYNIYHAGFELQQNSWKGLDSNPGYYFREDFAIDGYTTTKDISYDYEGTSYTLKGIDVPIGWTYATEGQYPSQVPTAVTRGIKYASYKTGAPYASGEVYFQMNGAFMSLRKMVDIEPGYQYTVITDAAKSGSSNFNRVDTRVHMYHKNDDGTYTPINTYLTEKKYTKTLDEPTYKEGKSRDNSSDGSAVEISSGSGYYDATHSVVIEITDPNVNVLMIEIGGWNGQGCSQSGYYNAIKISQDKTLPLDTTNTRPVAVNYDLGTNGGTQQATVNAIGAGEVSLRPVTAADGTTKIVSASGYFKGWQIGSKTYTSEKGKKAPFTDNDTTLTMNALWYAESELVNTAVSSAAAQAVTLNSGAKAIRFLALVGADYENYAEAGFVITTLAANPTVEAGYIPRAFNSIYKSINVGGESWSVNSGSVLSKFNYAETMVPTGITYANLVIDNEATVYYATPYVKTTNGVLIYGETKAASYSDLAALDAE